jgi:glutathione S-transferase
MDPIVAVVTLAALLFYFWTGLSVGMARGKSGIDAPAMTGHPVLERAVRVHMNTLEWLPIFLVSLWLFATFVTAPWGRYAAAGLGVVWIVGRYLYMTGYMADPKNRSTGFLTQMVVCLILFVGALAGAIMKLAAGA